MEKVYLLSPPVKAWYPRRGLHPCIPTRNQACGRHMVVARGTFKEGEEDTTLLFLLQIHDPSRLDRSTSLHKKLV